MSSILTAKQLAYYCDKRAGIGRVAKDIFYSYLPEEPSTCIAIFDTGGWAKDPDLPRKDVTFQFRVRGTTYDEAQELADKIYKHFCPNGIPKKLFKIGQHSIQGVVFMQPSPYFLGRDENDRDEFAWNITLIVK